MAALRLISKTREVHVTKAYIGQQGTLTIDTISPEKIYNVPCSATENIKLFRTPCDELQTALYIGEGHHPKILVTCSVLPR